MWLGQLSVDIFMVVGQSTVIAFMFTSSSFILSTNIYWMSVVCKALNEVLSVSGTQVSGSPCFKTECCRSLVLTSNTEGWSLLWKLSPKKIHTLQSRNSFDTWILRELETVCLSLFLSLTWTLVAPAGNCVLTGNVCAFCLCFSKVSLSFSWFFFIFHFTVLSL